MNIRLAMKFPVETQRDGLTSEEWGSLQRTRQRESRIGIQHPFRGRGRISGAERFKEASKAVRLALDDLAASVSRA